MLRFLRSVRELAVGFWALGHFIDDLEAGRYRR